MTSSSPKGISGAMPPTTKRGGMSKGILTMRKEQSEVLNTGRSRGTASFMQADGRSRGPGEASVQVTDRAIEASV